MRPSATASNDAGNATIARALRRRILRQGPISFAEFMEVCLYHPRAGYYMTAAHMGRGGDYTTSPEIHPAFGILLGGFAAHAWQAMGSPPDFTVVEIGGGSGRLARDLLDSARRTAPAFYAALTYVMADISPAMRRCQRDLLRASHPGKAVWRSLAARRTRPLTGLILSNELIDALPFHRVVMRSGRLLELRVGLNATGLTWVEAEAGAALAEHIATSGAVIADGQVAEVRPAATDWLRSVASVLERGCLLTIDYGSEAQELRAARFPEGALACYSGGGICDDPLLRPGLQDISARVDFTALRTAGTAAGLTALPLMAQGEFLLRLGAAQFVEAARSSSAAGQRAEERRALRALLDPEGLGNCKVLIQHSGLSDEDAGELARLRPDNPVAAPAASRAAPAKPGWLSWQGMEV